MPLKITTALMRLVPAPSLPWGEENDNAGSRVHPVPEYRTNVNTPFRKDWGGGSRVMSDQAILGRLQEGGGVSAGWEHLKGGERGRGTHR